MKLLTVLSIAQIVAIVLLYGKFSALEQRLDRPAAEVPVRDSAPGVATPQTYQPSTNAYAGVDYDVLRQIIREELAVQSDTGAVQAATPDGADWAELEERREQVAQQINYYRSVGSISDVDMQKLQLDIARLDPSSRSQMLRELNRALNSGQLEGRP